MTLLIITVSLFAIVFGFTIITFFTINNLKRDLVNQSSLIAKLIAEYSEFALLFDDKKVALENLNNLRSIPFIEAAELYNSEGLFFASIGNKKPSHTTLLVKESSFQYISNQLWIKEPVFSTDNEWIGAIFLKVSLDKLDKNVQEYIIWMVLIILSVTIIIILMASSFQKIISNPILALANLTQEISNTGDYSMRIHKKTGDEIGLLYDGFNNMLEVIVKNELAMLEAQYKLEESEEQFSSFMENIPAAAFIKEQDSTYKYVNKFLADQFDGNSWIGKKNTETLPSQKRQLSSKLDTESILSTQNYEEYLYDIKNELRYFQTWKFPISRREKEPLIGGIAIDITKRKIIEEQINYYVKELERNNKELEEFNYVASHDLREPLRTITSYCDLLSEDIGENMNDMVKEDIKFITDATTRMNILIQDLLQLSRAGRVEFESTEVDLNQIFQDVLNDLQLKIKETEANIEIEDLPQITGDSIHLSRVFQNLITNAIKFRSEEKPVIKVYSKQKDGIVELVIEDNGIGIDPQYHKQIFSAFKRLHSRDQYEGTGIGLAICKKIIERHSGTIKIDSDVGKGSKFIITLKKS